MVSCPGQAFAQTVSFREAWLAPAHLHQCLLSHQHVLPTPPTHSSTSPALFMLFLLRFLISPYFPPPGSLFWYFSSLQQTIPDRTVLIATSIPSHQEAPTSVGQHFPLRPRSSVRVFTLRSVPNAEGTTAPFRLNRSQRQVPGRLPGESGISDVAMATADQGSGCFIPEELLWQCHARLLGESSLMNQKKIH